MSYTKHLHHIIFATKYRKKVFPRESLPEICRVMGQKLRHLNCKPILINGVEDHVHILCGVHAGVAIAELVKVLKIHSSWYIKLYHPQLGFTSWASGYASITFHHSMMEVQMNYVRRQWEHHHKVSSVDELKSFLDENEIVFDPKYLE